MISVNIASLGEREEQLKKTVASLIDQVDVVNICLNNYENNPFEGNDKVNVVFSNNAHGDAGKFLFVESFDGYYFTCDDDLVYPEDYIKRTIPKIDMYGIVSYHGRTFPKFPIMSYYKTPAIRNRCLAECKYTEPVQIPGTGVLAFHTKYFKPPFSIFKRKNMADVWIGCYAKEQGFKVWGLKHSGDFFKYQVVPNTIYEEKSLDCDYETRLVNQYFG